MHPLFFDYKVVMGIGLLLVVLTGCQSFGVTLNKEKGSAARNEILKNHVVMFDEDGHPVDPTGNEDCRNTQFSPQDPIYCNGNHGVLTNYPRLTPPAYHTHISNLIQAAMDHAAEQNSDKVKILFFVHGGLNTQVGSLERIIAKGFDPKREKETLHQLIMADTPFYPIFINWQSSLRSSYLDHLLYVRQGEKWSPLAGWLTAPVVLAVDVGRSILRAPLVWGSMIYNDARTAPELTRPLGLDKNLPDAVVQELLCPDIKDQTACLERFKENKAPSFFSGACWDSSRKGKKASVGDNLIVGVDERQCLEMSWKSFQWLVTIPAKLAISPFLDAFGKSAWDNMLRSIQLLYQVDENFHLPDKSTKPGERLSDLPPSGGLTIFLNELLRQIQTQPHTSSQGKAIPNEWEITWVGHSAGTIVINEAIRRFGLPEKQQVRLPFSTIVYMAAASTLGDIDGSVIPYLQNNSSTHFHHLMLHEKAEEGETVWDPFDLPPRGSLLIWIDEFLSNPLTHKERTAGKYQNFFRNYHSIPKSIRKRVHARVFSQGERVRSGNPMKHGDFTSRFKFWDRDCWATDFHQTNNTCVYP